MAMIIKTITSSRLADSKMAFLCLTVLVVALIFVACHKPAAQSPTILQTVKYVKVEERLVTLTDQLPGRTSAYDL
jgi:hypothetical protein